MDIPVFHSHVGSLLANSKSQDINRCLSSNQVSFNSALSLGNLIVFSEIQALGTEFSDNGLYHKR